MDEQRTPQTNGKPGSGRSAFDAYNAGSSPRAGKFKVNIDGLDNEPPVYVPLSSAKQPPQTPRPAARRPVVSNQPQARQGAPAQQPRQGTAAPRTGAVRQTPRQRAAAQKTASAKQPPKKKAAPQKKRRGYNFARGMMITLVCLICIGILTATVSTLALTTINDILAIKKDGGTTVSVVIPENSDFEDVYSILCSSGLIRQKMLCKLFCKFRHYDEYTIRSGERAGEVVKVAYEPGVYYIETDTGLENMLEMIKVSNKVSRETVRLTFPEGWTIAKIFERIEKYKVCTAEKLYANLDIVGKQFGFYQKIPANAGRYLKAEGYLFPDTYDFYIGEQASSVIKKLFSNFEEKWPAAYTKQAKKLGMTMDEVITLASIIQREAKDSTQMAEISSVLHNRLADPATYPQLQMNSTKEYIDAVNEYGLFSEVYYSIYLDAYNTYSAKGLPPGPICNPGIDAIKAALNPAQTNYHFFCHDSEGNIYLAETADEHRKNAELVLFK